jgi:hypothetical protein
MTDQGLQFYRSNETGSSTIVEINNSHKSPGEQRTFKLQQQNTTALAPVDVSEHLSFELPLASALILAAAALIIHVRLKRKRSTRRCYHY